MFLLTSSNNHIATQENAFAFAHNKNQTASVLGRLCGIPSFAASPHPPTELLFSPIALLFPRCLTPSDVTSLLIMLTDRRISISGPLASRVKSLGQKPKPIIEIILKDQQQDQFCPSYTSLDEIKGEVSITAPYDTSFDEVYITFEGTTRTYVEKIATTSPTNGRTEAFQSFLRLVQPMDGAAFPEPRIMEAGTTYKFPFTFNVPEQLLPQACNHKKDDTFPEDGHLKLPPSLGDPMVASMGRSLMDDMAPDMGSIAYAIRCRITSGRGMLGKHKVLVESSKKLRIIPAVQEEPPLNVRGGIEDDYKLRKEKAIKKGLFKGRLGRLVIQAAQPTSLRLPPLRSQDCSPVTTMATVNVRFDPAHEDSEPPRLNNLQAKLKVATFFASVPLQDLPGKSSDFHYSSVKGIYAETINLSSRCLANQPWEKHTSSTPVRGQSVRSMSAAATNIPEPSSAYNGKTFCTARVIVPISLPQGSKVFVPSFHTCLISRIYALDLYLSVNTPNAAITDPSLHLKLPIQVSQAGNPSAQSTITAQEANVMAAREANEFFIPRSVALPSPEYTEVAQLPPQDNAPPSPGPGYNHHEVIAAAVEGRASPRYAVRMNGTQQRFQSLSFENEEAVLAPPPDYSAIGGRNSERIATSMPAPLGGRTPWIGGV